MADGLFYVQFQPQAHPKTAVSLFLDLTLGRALIITATIRGAEPGRTALGHEFVSATIEGTEASGAVPAPTAALVGRRVLWIYSDVHAYEHIYLSPHLYTWQCLAGPERGLADTDQCTVYELRPGIYVFT